VWRAGTKFVPKAEERLLAVVHALLHRCYKMPCSNNAEVPASLKKELSGARRGPLLPISPAAATPDEPYISEISDAKSLLTCIGAKVKPLSASASR
jgi:transformation/transcription domain-associated protein